MDVVIIGAGAAGLAAAQRLCQAEIQTEVLEACEQVGGRARTVSSGLPKAPFEVGAEFIHGSNNAVWDMLRLAGLVANEVEEKHWLWSDGKMTDDPTATAELDRYVEEIDVDTPDISMAEFLRIRPPSRLSWLVRQFVEGFYAAHTDKISAHAVAAGATDVDTSYRIQGGYGRLIDWIRGSVEKGGGVVYLNTVVESIKWRQGKVEVQCQTPEGPRTFRATRAIVTLPLGVLKAKPDELGAVRFDPELSDKKRALKHLEMGKVVKVQYRFNQHFWRDALGAEDFGFLHARDGSLKTWWATPFGPVLTGWAGGPIDNLGKMEVVEAGLRDLAPMFSLSPEALREMLQDWCFHDWRADPFSRGAYSYTRIGGGDSHEDLAKPLAKTLYFAGEATAGGSAQGTVHGAISSGIRAAEEIIRHRG